MEKIFEKAVIGATTGVLLYICWYVLPPLKEKLVQKFEIKLQQHGLYNFYQTVHKILLTFLYVVLALMIIVPALFILWVILWNTRRIG